MNKKITIIHPSLGRPKLGTETVKSWMEKAVFPENIEYLLVLSEDDTRENKKEYLDIIEDYVYDNLGMIRDSRKQVGVFEIPNGTYINKSNFGASIGKGDIFIIISDDTACFDSWDIILLAGIELEKEKRGVDSCFTVKTKDGIQPFLLTMPIFDKAWYDRFGYILYPEYTHMYSDTDLSMVSHKLDRTLYVDLLFPHMHYSVGGMEIDKTNEKNNSTYNQGAEIFGKRGGNNFGLKPEEIINKEPIDIYRYDGFNK